MRTSDVVARAVRSETPAVLLRFADALDDGEVTLDSNAGALQERLGIPSGRLSTFVGLLAEARQRNVLAGSIRAAVATAGLTEPTVLRSRHACHREACRDGVGGLRADAQLRHIRPLGGLIRPGRELPPRAEAPVVPPSARGWPPAGRPRRWTRCPVAAGSLAARRPPRRAGTARTTAHAGDRPS